MTLFLNCRLRIAEAELSQSDLLKAKNFLEFKKEFSHVIYCLKTVFELLHKDPDLKKWLIKNYKGKEPFEYVRSYRIADLHDADHGFNIVYNLGFINVSKGATVNFGPGAKFVLQHPEGNSTFKPLKPGIATGEGIFYIDNPNTEHETWTYFEPENFPWNQSALIELPDAMKPEKFIRTAIYAYKKLLMEAEEIKRKKVQP